LYLLLLSLPLGVAGQNIGGTVAGLILLWQLWLQRREVDFAGMWARCRTPLVAALALLGVLVVATLLNPRNPARYNETFVGGHLLWLFVPPVVWLVQPRLAARDWQGLFHFLAGVSVFMTIVALSQNVWGWALGPGGIVSVPARAHGLYSHPMSLAYVSVLLFPLGCTAVFRYPRYVAAWTLALSSLICVFASGSRTVEAVSIGVLVVQVFIFVRGRARLALLGVMTAALLALAVTHNPVSQRFYGMLTHHDVHVDYPDDRFAFWQANFDMFLERPLIGHGDNLNTQYRSRYYDAIGLHDFVRQYEAHNMYLQVAVNAGILGLLAFLVWLVWHLKLAVWLMRRPASEFAGHAAMATLIALMLAALTQNAFQDSAVRYTLTALVTGLWLAARDLAPHSKSS